MKIYIRNMVCRCCKMTVKAELKKMGLLCSSIELGEVHLIHPIDSNERKKLSKVLHLYGLDLMEDDDAILVEKIVIIIVKMVHETVNIPSLNFSVFLSNKLNQNYTTLSTLFSKTKGVTIEHFIILHKIERAKELIMYDELSLTEISIKLHYSSVSHLSRQFKKVTGLTPTFFKNIKNKKRIPLESL